MTKVRERGLRVLRGTQCLVHVDAVDYPEAQIAFTCYNVSSARLLESLPDSSDLIIELENVAAALGELTTCWENLRHSLGMTDEDRRIESRTFAVADAVAMLDTAIQRARATSEIQSATANRDPADSNEGLMRDALSGLTLVVEFVTRTEGLAPLRTKTFEISRPTVSDASTESLPEGSGPKGDAVGSPSIEAGAETAASQPIEIAIEGASPSSVGSIVVDTPTPGAIPELDDLLWRADPSFTVRAAAESAGDDLSRELTMVEKICVDSQTITTYAELLVNTLDQLVRLPLVRAEGNKSVTTALAALTDVRTDIEDRIHEVSVAIETVTDDLDMNLMSNTHVTALVDNTRDLGVVVDEGSDDRLLVSTMSELVFAWQEWVRRDYLKLARPTYASDVKELHGSPKGASTDAVTVPRYSLDDDYPEFLKVIQYCVEVTKTWKHLEAAFREGGFQVLNAHERVDLAVDSLLKEFMVWDPSLDSVSDDEFDAVFEHNQRQISQCKNGRPIPLSVRVGARCVVLLGGCDDDHLRYLWTSAHFGGELWVYKRSRGARMGSRVSRLFGRSRSVQPPPPPGIRFTTNHQVDSVAHNTLVVVGPDIPLHYAAEIVPALSGLTP